jgi:hypothetical protein
MKLLPELTSYMEGLPEPHILFDLAIPHPGGECGLPAAVQPRCKAWSGAPATRFPTTSTCRVTKPGESCPLARSRASGQRERVLHLHHTPKGEEYVNIELAPLLNAERGTGFFRRKNGATCGSRKGQPAAQGLIGRAPVFQRHAGPGGAGGALAWLRCCCWESPARARSWWPMPMHQGSLRARRALVPVDCSSLPEAPVRVRAVRA